MGSAGTRWAELSQETQGSVEAEARPATRWEYAQLRREKRGKKRLHVVFSNPNSLVQPRDVRLPRISRWSALGLLGSDGWELVGVDGERYLFKRQVAGE